MSLIFTNSLRSHRKYLSLITHASKTCINLNHFPKAHYFLTPLCLSEDLIRIVGKGLMERKEAENMAMQEKKKLLTVATVQDHGVVHDVYKLIEEEKEEKEDKKVKVKGMAFRADISKNDLQRKSKQVSGFLEKGFPVLIRVTRSSYGKTSPKEVFEKVLSCLTVEVKKINLKADRETVYSCELIPYEVD